MMTMMMMMIARAQLTLYGNVDSTRRLQIAMVLVLFIMFLSHCWFVDGLTPPVQITNFIHILRTYVLYTVYCLSEIAAPCKL